MNRLAQYIGAALLASLMAACGDTASYEDHLINARTYIADGDFKSARVELINAVGKNPTDGQARYLMAKVQLQLGDFLAAEKEAQRAREAGVDAALTQPLIIAILFAQQRFDKVIEVGATLAEGIALADEVRVLAQMGQSYLSQLNIGYAEELIGSALELDPDSVDALLAMAALSASQEKMEDALEWAQRATEVAPSAAAAWSMLGDLEARRGRGEAALAAYSKAIEHRGYTSLDVARRARIEILQGELEQAAADIETLRASPYRGFWYTDHLKGLLSFGQRDYEGAASAFAAALNANPTFAESLLYAATAHVRLGNDEQALRLANRLLRETPNSLQANNIVSRALLREGKLTEALAVLREIEAANPENVEVLRLMGTAYLWQGETDLATQYAEKLVALDPDSEQSQQLLILSNLIGGADLHALFEQGVAVKDDFSRELWLAISDFKQGKHLAAQKRAAALTAAQPERLEPRRIVAAAYMARGEWQRGRDELDAILALSPNDYLALTSLTQLELLSGRIDAAHAALDKIVTLYPSRKSAVVFAHDMYQRLGDKARAEQVLLQALKRSPQDDELRVMLMKFYFLQRNFTQLIAVAQELPSEVGTERAAYYEFLGLAQLARNNAELAAGSFRKWIGLQPNSPYAHRRYAEAMVVAGNEQAARKSYEQALSIAPDNVDLAAEYIRFLAQSGQFEQAEAVLRRVAGRQSDANAGDAVAGVVEAVEIVELRGWLALLHGDFPRAEALLADAVQRRQTTNNTVLLARALAYQDRYPAALQVLDKWLADHPDDLEVMLHKAGALLAQGDDNGAREAYEAVLKYYPEHIPSLNNVAWLSREADLGYALETAEKAYQLRNRDPIVLDTLGNIKLLAGQTDEGLALLRSAHRIAPDEAKISLSLAQALVGQGEKTEAESLLRSIVRAVPESDEARQASALLDGLGASG